MSRRGLCFIGGFVVSIRHKYISTLGLVVASFALLYWRVIGKLVHDWATDDNYSHGFLIVPLAGYLIWERREKLEMLTPRPTRWGLAIVCGSVVVLLAGLIEAGLDGTRDLVELQLLPVGAFGVKQRPAMEIAEIHI